MSPEGIDHPNQAWLPGSCDECGGGHTCHEGNSFTGHAASCSKNPGRTEPQNS